VRRAGVFAAAGLVVTFALVAGCGTIIVGAGAGIVAATGGGGGGGAAAPPAPVNALPGATVTVAEGDQADVVAIDIRLTDAEGDAVDIEVEMQVPGGGTIAVTEARTSESCGTKGLAASRTGVLHRFLWRSFTDLGGVNVAGLRAAVLVTERASGRAVAEPFLSDAFLVRNADVATIASGSDLPRLTEPRGLALQDGRVFVADPEGHVVVRYDPVASSASLLAGTGVPGFDDEDIPALTARLERPTSLAADPARGAILLIDEGRTITIESGAETVAAFLNQRVLRVDLATGFLEGVLGARPGDDPTTRALRRAPTGPSDPRPAREVDLLPGTRAIVRGDALLVLEPSARAVWAVPLGGAPVTLPDGRALGGTITVDPGTVVPVLGDLSGTSVSLTAAPFAGLDGTLVAPVAIALGPDGLVYVADVRSVIVAGLGLVERLAVVAWNAGALDVVTRVIDDEEDPLLPSSVTIAPGDAAIVFTTDAIPDFTDGVLAVDAGHDLVLGAPSQDGLLFANGSRSGADVGVGEETIEAGRSAVVFAERLSEEDDDAEADPISAPRGLLVDGTIVPPDIYVADGGQERVRVVNPGDAARTIAREVVPGGAAAALPIVFVPDEIALTSTRALAVDPSGEILVAAVEADQDGDPVVARVVRIDAGARTLETVAGAGVAGFTGDGGPARAARIDDPAGLAFDAAGNLWIGDVGSDRIRFVNRGAAPVVVAGVTVAPGAIATIAGTGAKDDALAAETPLLLAALDAPGSLAVDPRGVVFVALGSGEVAALPTGALDVAIGGGAVVLHAGTIRPVVAASLGIEEPTLALDARGGLAIMDGRNGRVWFYNAGDEARTVAGLAVAPGAPAVPVAGAGPGAAPADDPGDGVPLADALFGRRLSGVFQGEVLIVADADNGIVRALNLGPAPAEVVPGQAPVEAGQVRTIAGARRGGALTLESDAPGAVLGAPSGIALTGDGLLLVGEAGSGMVRALSLRSAPSVVAGRLVAPGEIGVVAGTPAGGARLVRPSAVALAPSEHGPVLVISDGGRDATAGRRVHAVDPRTGARSVIAGGGDDDPRDAFARGARLEEPRGILSAGPGLLLVCDRGANRVFAVSTGDSPVTALGVEAAPGAIEPVIGSGKTSGLSAGCVRNETLVGGSLPVGATSTGCAFVPDPDIPVPTGSASLLGYPVGAIGLAGLDATRVFVVDEAHLRVRVARDAASPPPPAVLSTLAALGPEQGLGFAAVAVTGTPSAALAYFLVEPGRVVRAPVDASGAFTGPAEAVVNAGGQPGFNGHARPRLEMRLQDPRGLAIDDEGDLYVADTGNNRVVFVNLGASSKVRAGVVAAPGSAVKIAGGNDPDAPPALGIRPPGNMSLGRPVGIAIDGAGNVTVAEEGARRVIRFATRAP